MIGVMNRLIVCRLSDEFLRQRMLAMLRGSEDGRLGMPKVSPEAAKKIVVDFSSPNIAKEMHVVSPSVSLIF